MGISRTHGRAALRVEPLLVALLISGCAGSEPFEPRDEREEGPAQGLFTGSRGEWVIHREEENKGEQKTESEREQKKRPEKSADGYQ